MGIESLEDALLLLRGEFVICSPSRDFASSILESSINSATTKPCLVYLSAQPKAIDKKKLRAVVDVTEINSFSKATRDLKKVLVSLPRRTRIYVDLSNRLPPTFGSREKQKELIVLLRKLCVTNKLQLVYCLWRNALDSEALSLLKDGADFFLDVSRVGSLHVTQFISAKGIHDSDFFFPRVIKVSTKGITFSSTRIPSDSLQVPHPDDEGSTAVTLFEKQYREVFDNAAEGMVLFELWGDYKEFNKRAKDILGYSDAELNSLELKDLIVATKKREVVRALITLKKKGRLTFATQVKRKNGRSLDVEFSAASLGKNTFVAICTDISEKLQTESAAQGTHNEYKNFVASLPYPYAIFVNRKLTAKNEAFTRLFPWIADATPSLSDFFGRKNADVVKHLTSLLDNPPEENSIRNKEILIPAGERKTVAAEFSASAIQYEGKPSLYCTFVDVSERRKILDEAENTEERFKALLESSLEAISVSQGDRFTLVNNRFLRMFGYDSGLEVIGKEITSIISGRNARNELSDVIQKQIASGKAETFRYEYTGLKKDGSKIDVELQGSVIMLDGNPTLLSYHKDVTNELKTRDEYQRKIKGLEILNRVADEVIAAKSVDEMFQRGMNAAMKILGFEIAASFAVDKKTSSLTVRLHHGVNENILSKIGTQKLDEGLARFFNKTHNPVIVGIDEYPPYLHYKSLFEAAEYKILAFLPLVVEQELHGVLMLASTQERAFDDNDRTLLSSLNRQLNLGIERSLLAEHARRAEERFTSTVKNISDVLYTLQPNGSFEYVSPNIETLIGFRPADFYANAGLWRTLLHPDDRPNISLRVSNQAQTLDEFSLEYRIQPKGKASYMWLRDMVRYDRDANGNVTAVNGILDDITDRKRLSEFESAVALQPKQDIFTADITESEEILRDVIDAMDDALLISDLEGEVWEVNRAFTLLTGYERDEVRLSKFPYPWLQKGEMTKFIEWVAALADKKHLHDLDMTWRHRNGHSIALSLNTTLLTNAQGEPMAILNIARDISERRRLSIELEWKNKHIELLNRIIGFANTTLDLNKIFDTLATEIHALIPFEGLSIAFVDDDGKFSPVYHAVPTETGQTQKVDHIEWDMETARMAIRRAAATVKEGDGGSIRSTGIPSQISIPLFVNEKVLGVFNITSLREQAFTGDELSLLQPIADQVGAIVQRVQLFEQVSNDSTYVRNLLNSLNNVVYTVDSEYHITAVNRAWQDFMVAQGHTEWVDAEKVIGQSLQTVIPDDELWTQHKRVMDDLFARRLDHYSRDFEIAGEGGRSAYHLIINPMVINNKVTALVFTHTDITEINRTEAEIRQRNKELMALNAIATSISTSLELEEILRVATEQVQQTFDANVVAFYLLDEEKNQLVLSHHIGISEDSAEAVQRLDVDASLIGTVIMQRKPVYVSHVTSDDQPRTDSGIGVMAALGLGSTGVVPMQSKERVPGAFLISFAKSHVFTDNEQQLLLLIGNQLGAAIENAQLYSEVQQQVKTLTTLYELGKGLTGVLDLNSMLQLVYREIRTALPVEKFYYQAYLRDQNALSLLSRTVSDVVEFYPAGVRATTLPNWPNAIYQRVVAHGTSFIGSTDDTPTDSMIAVPIKSEEKVTGIISVAASGENVYTNVHLRLLESIANLTGVAISKATLYEDTLKKSSEIENRNKELDDFTYVVSHDLKEPLISIDGYSKIVLKDYKDKLDKEGKEYLGAVVQSTTHMKHLIDDLLTLSRVGRMNEAYESVSVRKLVDEILHDLQFSLKEKNVIVSVADDMPQVHYSSTRLSMVFRNLLSNAMKFNDKPNPRIEIGVRENDNEYIFSVTDNGIGIEPQYFDRIFTIFQRLKRSEEYRGTGAGLTIAKKIVEREEGRIWVDSVPGEGSTFYFTIRKTS